MRSVYLVRHAQADAGEINAPRRPLTQKGRADSETLAKRLLGEAIAFAFASPYARAVDTLAPLANAGGLAIRKDGDFREWSANARLPQAAFLALLERKWADFESREGGESFASLQKRTLRGLKSALILGGDNNIAICAHGIALAALIRYYCPEFRFEDFQRLLAITPYALQMQFDGFLCAGMKLILPAPAQQAHAPCRVKTAPVGQLGAYRFVVVFARTRGKWVYCRAKTRESWETPGGHIEKGETPTNAARRELYEETGASAFDMRPMFDYAVYTQGEYAFGRVYLADVRAFGPLPPYEMAEIRAMDGIPENMRFPHILPELMRKIQEIENIV